jgi:hypothetical protein
MTRASCSAAQSEPQHPQNHARPEGRAGAPHLGHVYAPPKSGAVLEQSGRKRSQLAANDRLRKHPKPSSTVATLCRQSPRQAHGKSEVAASIVCARPPHREGGGRSPGAQSAKSCEPEGPQDLTRQLLQASASSSSCDWRSGGRGLPNVALAKLIDLNVRQSEPLGCLSELARLLKRIGARAGS